MRYATFAIAIVSLLTLGAWTWEGAVFQLPNGSQVPVTKGFPLVEWVLEQPARRVVKASSDRNAVIYILVDQLMEPADFTPEAAMRIALSDPDLELRGIEGDWPHLDNTDDYDVYLVGFVARDILEGTASFFLIAERDDFDVSKSDFWTVIGNFSSPILTESNEPDYGTWTVLVALALLASNVGFLWKAFKRYAFMTPISEEAGHVAGPS